MFEILLVAHEQSILVAATLKRPEPIDTNLPWHLTKKLVFVEKSGEEPGEVFAF